MNLYKAFPRTTAGIRNVASIFFILCAVLQNPAFAAQLKTLAHFNGSNGSHPYAGLVLDAAGKLYGTTLDGGQYDAGTVFQLTPPAPGKTAWTRKTLVNFNTTNGKWPRADLVFDTAGKLYGTTQEGGQYNAGTVFQLTPRTPGQTAWIRKTLVNFNGTNGAGPTAGVVLDGDGKLYGTTAGGRTVFQLTPPAPGHTAWTLDTLVTFDGFNGGTPTAGLTLDSDGNLYGTTTTFDYRTVFQLTPPLPGLTAWTLDTLASFFNSIMYVTSPPKANNLVFDAAGKLYGTTSHDGQYGYGMVFQMIPPAPGHTQWTPEALVNFNITNGARPYAGLVIDAATGKLYGTTRAGGQYRYGTVFQLTPPVPGQTAWIHKTLVNFNGTNGSEPIAGLVLDAAGKLCGTTSKGGKYGYGTVFQLTP